MTADSDLAIIARYASSNPPYLAIRDSARPGPHLVVNSITHGDETCGLHAALRVLEDLPRLEKGRVTFVFSNWHALSAEGGARRFIEHDMNRLWDEHVDGAGVEIERMRELRPLFFSADFLLDLHSLPDQDYPFAIATGVERSRKFAQQMPVSATLIMPEGLARGLTLIEAAPFRNETSHQAAIVMECGRHQSRDSIDIAESSIWAALDYAGLIDHQVARRHVGTAAKEGHSEYEVHSELVCERGDWEFLRSFTSFERLGPREPLALDGGVMVRSPDIETYVILTRPCRSRGDEAMTLGILVN